MAISTTASGTDMVTGAFGYTGSRIAERLLAQGRRVLTLSRRGGADHPLANRVHRIAYDFDEAVLTAALTGVETVYVTYWMRFPRGETTWEQVVDNVARLARASAAAGVRRLVYVSVSNAGHDSSTPYFRAKAAAEDRIRAAGISHAIVRPTLLYGPSDILINNMAWTLRRLPVFGIPGNGEYRVQPVHVDDVADMCVRLGGGARVADVFAAGPETFTFNDLTRVVRDTVGSRAFVTHMPPLLVLASTKVVGLFVRDVILTRDEIRELMESLLVADDPAGTCPTRLTDWLTANRATVGRRYSSELERNFRLAGS